MLAGRASAPPSVPEGAAVRYMLEEHIAVRLGLIPACEPWAGSLASSCLPPASRIRTAVAMAQAATAIDRTAGRRWVRYATLALRSGRPARATISSARSTYGLKPMTFGASATKFDRALTS